MGPVRLGAADGDQRRDPPRLEGGARGAAGVGEDGARQRLWLYLRERYLSPRLFADLDDIIDGCCDAWNRMVEEQDASQR
jgi:hypothetical protein